MSGMNGMNGVRELLCDYVTGALTADDARRVESALDSSPELRRERDELEAAFGQVAHAAPRTAAPRPELRERLLSEAGGARRFEPFVDKLAQLFDIAVEKAREFLGTLDVEQGWVAFAPTILYQDFVGGPVTAGARVGIVRVAAGHAFPMHRHIGREVVLILQGATREDDRVYRAGDTLEMADGTQHTTPAIGDTELIYAVVSPDVEIEGIPLPPVERP